MTLTTSRPEYVPAGPRKSPLRTATVAAGRALSAKDAYRGYQVHRPCGRRLSRSCHRHPA